MLPIVNIFKSIFRLHRSTFNAPFYKLLNIPTIFSVGFKQVTSLLTLISDSPLFLDVAFIASQLTSSRCAALLTLHIYR